MAIQTNNPTEKVKGNTPSNTIKDVQKEAKPFQQFLMKFNNDGTMTFAATLAYNLMLAMFPILIALIGILGITLGRLDANAVAQIQDKVAGAFPTSQSTVLQIVKAATSQLQKGAWYLVIIAILTAIFGGSRLFIVIEQFFDLTYHLRPRPFLRQNAVAIGMLLLFVLLIPVMVLASAAPALVISLTKFIPFLGTNHVVALILSYIGAIVSGIFVGFILFESIYVVMPNQKVSWRHSWLGALVAAIALEIFLFAFPFYAAYFLRGYAGVIGGGIILLLFFYYFAVILLLGAEINSFFSEGVQPLPNDIITFVSTMAGRVNKDRPNAESSIHMDAKPTERADDARFHGRYERGGNTNHRNSNNLQYTPSNTKGNDSKKSHKDSDKSEKVTAKAQEKSLTQSQKSLAQSQKDFAKAQKEMTKEPKVQSPTATALEIAAGAALTVVIEFLRLRRHGGK